VDSGAERAHELEARMDELKNMCRLYRSGKPLPNPDDHPLPLPWLIQNLAVDVRRRWALRTD
jgi:hypothetical protein